MHKFSLKNLLKILIPTLILFFLFYTIVSNWYSVKDNLLTVNVFNLIIPLTILMVTFLGGAFFWQKILSDFNLKIPYFETLRIFTVSNFGRFIPGVVVHYLARVYMSKKIGIGVKQSAMTVVLEAYYTLVGAILIGGLGLSILADLINFSKEFFLFLYLLIVLITLFLPPRILLTSVSKLPFLKKIDIKIARFNYKKHLFLCLLSAVLFILNGIAFYSLSFNFYGLDVKYLPVIVGLFSLSWITGFLTPVAPGGLGVSDLSFVFLLSPFYTFPEASFLVVLYRIGLLAAEGLVFMTVLAFSKAELFSIKSK